LELHTKASLKSKITRLKGKLAPHKTLIQNFSYLSALQVFNLLLPLITYPYLIRVLGKETYGLVVFAQAIVAYLVILVGFGFNLSATRYISIHRDDKEKISEIVSSVLIIKGILFLFSCLIMGSFLLFIPQAQGHKTLFLLSLWACLYDVIFPIWYFQGKEQMKYITYISLTSRLIFLCLVFIFIKSPADYLFVPIVYGVGALIAGSFSLLIIFGKDQICLVWQPISILKVYFKETLPIFYSNLFISAYVFTNKVIIGSFIGLTEVAYYDLAEKLTAVLKIPQTILSQSIFPKISKEKNLGFVKRIFKLSLGLNVMLFLLTVIFSHYIIILLGGEQMLPAIWVVNILALTVPIIGMSNTFGLQLLIPFGLKKQYSKTYLYSSVLYVILVFITYSTGRLTIWNISTILLITELFVTSHMFYLCKKHIDGF
jgi:PST family polysaccharide transporter